MEDSSQNLLSRAQETVLEKARLFEDKMREDGFFVGDKYEYHSKKFNTNGNHDVYVGYEEAEGRKSYCHCGSGRSLGLSCPVVNLSFVIYNFEQMKSFFQAEGEGILLSPREIELRVLNPEFAEVREASGLIDSIEGWLKENGEKFDLAKQEFFFDPYRLII